MVELLFIACLGGASVECREYSLVFTGITPRQCLSGAQPELAKWVASHDGARILEWRCRTVSLAERRT